MSQTLSIYDTGIGKAVEAAGGVTALGRRLGVTRQSVYLWLKDRYVPNGRAAEIAALYGIPTRELVDPKLAALVGGQK